MNALVPSLLLVLAYLSLLSSPLAYSPIISQPTSPVSDVGQRFKVCFTATESPSNLTTTKCLYITVVGACTLATADVNMDGIVNIGDLAIVALHYHENRTSPEPYNPLDTSQVGLEDLSCIASHYHQADPLP